MNAFGMSDARLDPTWLEEIGAAATIAALLVFSPLLRPWYCRWGATAADAARPLPGDELVPRPRLATTRAITILAPAAEVWPWLVQIGQGRGGLYSYTRLENLVGCDIHNAGQIMPEFQQLQVGDVIRLAPGNAPFFEVAAVEPPRTLVLKGGGPQVSGAAPPSWAFCLDQTGDSVTRLIVRYRMEYPPGLGNLLIWRGIMDPLFFVMERRMLIGIQRRADLHARRQSPATQ
jgi:hypothetical protein